MSAAAIYPTRTRTIALWVLRILIAGVFVLAAFMKLSGQPAMVEEFGTVGLGQWFRYLTGVLELAGGVAILVPRYSVFGAILLLIVDIGAFFAQILVLHMDFIHTLVFAAVIGAAIYLQRETLSGRRFG